MEKLNYKIPADSFDKIFQDLYKGSDVVEYDVIRQKFVERCLFDYIDKAKAMNLVCTCSKCSPKC